MSTASLMESNTTNFDDTGDDNTTLPFNTTQNNVTSLPTDVGLPTYKRTTETTVTEFLIPVTIILCVAVVCLSFKKNGRHFFSWKLVQRFVVIHTSCDLAFYGAVVTFATQIRFTNRVPGHTACSAYAFVILLVSQIQTKLNVVAAACALFCIRKSREPKFGKYDWKLFAWMLTPAVVASTLTVVFDGNEFNGV